MAISMLKIRRPLERLIFNMGIAIPGKTVFLIETAPWILHDNIRRLSKVHAEMKCCIDGPNWFINVITGILDSMLIVNSLAPGWFEHNFRYTILVSFSN